MSADTPEEEKRRRDLASRFSHPLTTKEQRAEITRRYRDGESCPRIAKAMGLKATTVRGYCIPRNPYF